MYESDEYVPTVGVKGPLSPLLFSLYISDVDLVAKGSNACLLLLCMPVSSLSHCLLLLCMLASCCCACLRTLSLLLLCILASYC